MEAKKCQRPIWLDDELKNHFWLHNWISVFSRFTSWVDLAHAYVVLQQLKDSGFSGVEQWGFLLLQEESAIVYHVEELFS